MAELADGLVFNLADTLTGHTEDLADLLQGVGLSVIHTEPQAQHVGLPVRQGVQDLAEGLGQQGIAGGIRRAGSVVVLHEGADGRVLLVAHRRVQRQGIGGGAVGLDDLLDGEIQFVGDLLQGRLTAQLLHQLAVAAGGLVDDLYHMHRHADGSRLIGNGTGDGLPDPPGRICREFVSLCIVELVDSADQARIALLNQVQDMQAASAVFLGDRHHQAQVGLRQLILGFLVALGHTPGQLLLLLGGQQRDLADLLQIHPHRIVQVKFCCQLHRIDQRLLLFRLAGDHVHIINALIQHVLNLRLGAEDLNSHSFKGIIDLLDLFHRKVQLFQSGQKFSRGQHAVPPAFADQTGQRSHQFLTGFSAFV